MSMADASTAQRGSPESSTPVLDSLDGSPSRLSMCDRHPHFAAADDCGKNPYNPYPFLTFNINDDCGVSYVRRSAEERDAELRKIQFIWQLQHATHVTPGQILFDRLGVSAELDSALQMQQSSVSSADFELLKAVREASDPRAIARIRELCGFAAPAQEPGAKRDALGSAALVLLAYNTNITEPVACEIADLLRKPSMGNPARTTGLALVVALCRDRPMLAARLLDDKSVDVSVCEDVAVAATSFKGLPLILAAERGYAGVVRALCSKISVRLDGREPRYSLQYPAFYLAALYGRVEVLRFLLEEGARRRELPRGELIDRRRWEIAHLDVHALWWSMMVEHSDDEPPLDAARLARNILSWLLNRAPLWDRTLLDRDEESGSARFKLTEVSTAVTRPSIAAPVAELLLAVAFDVGVRFYKGFF
eukprot:tig00020553_g10519.t1